MCIQCNVRPVYEFTNKRKVCAKCFVRYFDKKVLATIRKFEMIQKNDIIYCKKGNDFRSVVLLDVLKMFATRFPCEIITSNKKYTKKAIPSSIDLDADKIIHILMNGKEKDIEKISAVKGKEIKPLFLFLDEEIFLYAKIKKLKFKIKKEKKDKLSIFLDSLEKKHPEVKRAIINSYLSLYKK